MTGKMRNLSERSNGDYRYVRDPYQASQSHPKPS